MKLDYIFGPPRHPRIIATDMAALRESARRNSIQHHTLQGYISENRIIRYLARLVGLSDVTKIPDYDVGHGGDVSFVHRGQRYTMEIKTLTLHEGSGKLRLKPSQRGTDDFYAYRRDAFDFVGVNIVNRNKNGMLFARTSSLPSHKKDDRFLQATMILHEVKRFAPFVHSLKAIL